jgi:TrmH family RNA methyltransferase
MRETIGGIKHPAYRDALALTRQGGREATARYLVEDLDLVRQALDAPGPVYAVFVASEAGGRELSERCAARGAPLYVLSGSGLITKLIGTAYETAATAVAVVGKVATEADEFLARLPADALVLAGERIQDPRNVGVLVRTADAVGCAALLLSADSAEPYSRQAVRSTTGSILRLPLCVTPDLPGTLLRLRAEKNARVVVSSGQASATAFDIDLAARPLVLVVGNEQEGASRATIGAATDFVRLPMAAHTRADSLNVTVAAGALLYEAVRQRTAAR